MQIIVSKYERKVSIMNKYLRRKEKQRTILDRLPVKFAFSMGQFDKAMAEFGLDPVQDYGQIVAIGSGGIMKKSEVHLLEEAFEQYQKELDEILSNDDDLVDALVCELENHEYCITGEFGPACNAVGVVCFDDRTMRLLEVARKKYWQEHQV